MKVTSSLQKLYRRRKRGVALAMALMATVLLMILAVSFSMLSIEHARSSSGRSDIEVAKTFAEWGLDTTITCMGIGSNWDVNNGINTSFSMIPLFIPDTSRGASSTATLVSPNIQDPTGNQVTVDVLQAPDPNDPQPVTRLLYNSNGTGYSLPIITGLNTSAMVARVEVEARSLFTNNGLRTPQFELTSTATLYPHPGAGGVLDINATEPIATRVMRAVVRERAPLDDLHYVANAREHDAIGVSETARRSRPNVVIPVDYVQDGGLTVTGTEDGSNPNAGHLAFLLRADGTSDAEFRGEVSISQLGNVDHLGRPLQLSETPFFREGISTGQEYTPLPNQDKLFSVDTDGDGSIAITADPTAYLDPNQDERGTLRIAASDTTNPEAGSSFESGFISISSDDIRTVHNDNKTNGRHWSRDREGDGVDDIPVEMANYNPPIPEVEVVLGEDAGGNPIATVNAWNPLEGDGGIGNGGNTNGMLDGYPKTIPVSKLKNKTIYVEGGNVSVRSELRANGEPVAFEDQLTVAVGEHPGRRRDANGKDVNTAETIYHPTADLMRYTAHAATKLTQGGSTAPNPNGGPSITRPAIAFNAPPYSLADLKNPQIADLGSATVGQSQPMYRGDGTGVLEKAFTNLSALPPDTQFVSSGSVNVPAIESITSDPVMKQAITMMVTGEARIGQKMNRAQLAALFQESLDGIRDANSGAYGNDNAKSFWQPPIKDINREGNLNIVGDIRKGEGEGSSIGLIAENHILLSDRTRQIKRDRLGGDAEKTLNVDAVLTSVNHSVQFDWSNASNNRVMDTDKGEWLRIAPMLYDPNDASRAFNGQFNLNGSIISRFIDVEGDTVGRGYTSQTMNYDDSLRNFMPPMIPRFNFADFPPDEVTIEWVVQSVEDLGSKTTVD